jgi:glycosyltransferase involved in cell wall biosynthesis
MRVLVAAASHACSISGIQRHALNLTRCLAAVPIEAVDLVVSPWQGEMLRQAGMESSAQLKVHTAAMHDGAMSRNLWYYRGLPQVIERLRPDIVHLTYPVPVNHAALRCPVVVSLHDLYPLEIPENFPSSKVFFNRFVLKQCLRTVDAITCVSDTTLMRLRDYTPERVWQKAVRVFNCVEPHQRQNDSPLNGWPCESFLLCVAQHRRNKNIPLLLRIFRRLVLGSFITSSMKLVIVGIDGPETSTIHRLIADLGLSHRVQLVQGMCDAELNWCYTHCAAVVVPSTTEGFGLPVAEALLAGCRVICSDIAALREVGGNHCHFVPLGPDAEAEFASAIAQSLRDQRPSQIALPRFAASTLGPEYLSLYKSLLASAAEQRARRDELAGVGPADPSQQLNPNLREVRRGRI